MEKQVNKIIQDKFYSLLAEGVEKFPTSVSTPQINIANCSLCPLSKTRKKVVVSTEIMKKKFFILSEFPEQEDENSQTKYLYSEKSSANLIVKLLEKLGILQECHFSFALKCFPEKGIPDNSLSICAKNNLSEELKIVNPEIILCFGHRAMFALEQLNPSLHALKTVLFLSSSRDLLSFPHWRTQVWKTLEVYKVT